MNSTIKNVSIIIALLVLNSFSHTVLAADSVRVPKPEVKAVITTFLLAQGSVSSSGPVDQQTTNLRCPNSTKPIFKSSIKETELNTIVIPEGLHNSLILTSDYKMAGNLYMKNQSYANGQLTANWQIWCEPTKTA